MRAFSEMLAGAYASCCQCISQCCIPVTSYLDEKSHFPGTQKSFVVIRDEPSLAPPASAAPFGSTEMHMWERAPKRKHGSGRSSLSLKRRLLSSNTSSSSRRPQISAPTNFRHLHSESFRFPDYGHSQARPRPSSFRPLQLSIYMPEQQLSPILPHLDYPSPPVTPPERIYPHYTRSEGSQSMTHTRSYSSLSFHIPRRPVKGGSVFDSPSSEWSTPQRPAPARLRAYTSPPTPSPVMEDLVERVASAMVERDRLQEQIDDIVERQSIYISSRPSTAYGQPEMEPMPDIPALPPKDAPSFSQRLSSDRPRTAPSRQTVQVSPYQPNEPRRMMPPPPLPLRLRPPLRKKKSFSRVSTWLFPNGDGQHHERVMSLDSITNVPRPVSNGEGFYQVAAPEPNKEHDFDTDSTVSDWTAEEEQTLPTSLSPSSTATPRAMAQPTRNTPIGLQEPINLPQRQSVGVAV
ncbi:hypothetical protein F4778DRAFT_796171 [Xylariomycetidae sp. FL2044]|nr:hypothetical protein F4778DRAFT_796171 [Xylariomycetidae sp. FL2044]